MCFEQLSILYSQKVLSNYIRSLKNYNCKFATHINFVQLFCKSENAKENYHKVYNMNILLIVMKILDIKGIVRLQSTFNYDYSSG